MFRLDFQERNQAPKSVRLDCSLLQAMKMARDIRRTLIHSVVDVYYKSKWIKEYC